MQEARKMGLNVPFIILTGFGDGGLGNELIERGAADFVSKEELGADMLVSKISAVVDKNN